MLTDYQLFVVAASSVYFPFNVFPVVTNIRCSNLFVLVMCPINRACLVLMSDIIFLLQLAVLWSVILQ